MKSLFKWIISFVLLKHVMCVIIINVATAEQNGLLINLRRLGKSNAKINDNQKIGKCDILNGDLNLLGWAVLKSNMVLKKNMIKH